MIEKNFNLAESLFVDGITLEDIAESTFQKALYEFLNDYEIMDFLIKHNFNCYYFTTIFCVDEKGKIWGIVARAYFYRRMDIVELLFKAGFELFDGFNGQYINNEGRACKIWDYCFKSIFDRQLMDLMLAYGYPIDQILIYIHDPDYLNNKAEQYILNNPKIEWKGYSLGKFRKIEKPKLPTVGLFMSKEKKERYLRIIMRR